MWFYSPSGNQTFMAGSAAFQKPCAGQKPSWGAFLICNYEELLFFSFLFSVNILLSDPLLCLVAQSCPTLCDPFDCRPPGSSVHGIYQARLLEWVAISSSRGSSQLRDWICISRTAGGFFFFFNHWATQKTGNEQINVPSRLCVPQPPSFTPHLQS